MTHTSPFVRCEPTSARAPLVLPFASKPGLMPIESIDSSTNREPSRRVLRAWILLLLGALCLSLAACQQPARVVVVDATTGAEHNSLAWAGRVRPLDERHVLAISIESIARVDALSGTKSWKISLPATTQVFATPGRPLAIFDSLSAEFSTIDLERGTTQVGPRIERARAPGLRQALLVGGALWCTTYDGGVFLRTAAGEYCDVAPSQPDLEILAVPGRVLVLGKDAHLRAFHEATADPSWEFVFSGGASTLSAVPGAPARALVAARDGAIACLDSASGTPLWRAKLLGRNPRVAFATSPEQAWIAADGFGVLALDLRDGSITKQVESNEMFRSIAVIGDLVVVRTYEGEVRAYDRATGDLRWEFEGGVTADDRVVLIAARVPAVVL